MRRIGRDGPDGELWARLMAVQSRVPEPEWPVWGLAGRHDEVLAGAGYSSSSTPDGGMSAEGIDHVELAYGQFAGAPSVVVDTRPAGGHLESLDEVLDLHWANRRGVDYPVVGPLPDGSAFGRGLPDAPRANAVVVDTEIGPLAGQVQTVEDVTIVRFQSGEVVVTAVADQWPDGLRFRLVSDLTPATQRRLRRLEERRAAALAAGPPPEPPKLTGPDDTEPLWAHKGLVALLFERSATATPHDDSPRRSRRLPEDWGRRWEAAERRQQELRNQTPSEAADYVQGMANQLQTLGREPWWSDPQLRQQAVDEIVWVTATGEHNVSSAAAQRAFVDFWGTPRGGVFASKKTRRTEGSSAEPPKMPPQPPMKWQQAWRAWAASQAAR